MIELFAFILLPAALLVTTARYEPPRNDAEYLMRQRLLRIQQRVCGYGNAIAVQVEDMAESLAPLVHDCDRASERMAESTARLVRCMRGHGL